MASNLPPGCTHAMIEAQCDDGGWEAAMDHIAGLGLRAEEVVAACEAWKNHVRPLMDEEIKDRLADERMAQEFSDSPTSTQQGQETE